MTAGDTGILTLGLFLACSLIVFMRSSFATMNTARYLVPLAPAAAILMAYLLAMLPGRVKPWLASAVVLLLLATQVPALRDLGIQSERSTRYAKQTEQINLRPMYRFGIFMTLFNASSPSSEYGFDMNLR